MEQSRGKPWGVRIRAVGKAVPEKVVTNQDLEKILDTSDEWIRTRTGIRERRIVEKEVASSDLAERAAREVLAKAGWDPEDLDLIVVASATPDHIFPSTAAMLQAKLGTDGSGAFDVSAACSGFVYALSTAAAQVKMGVARKALVVGAETLSKIVDWTDRSTAVLLGDGAGAVLLEPTEEGAEDGILSVYLGADGRGGDLLIQPAGGSRHPASEETVKEGLHYLKMNGREVFKFAVQIMGDAAEEALKRAGLGFDDVDLYVPHQANQRIIDASARRFGLPAEKVWVNIDRYGNTSSASIPIALAEAEGEGRLKKGDIVLLVAFGGGLTWGAAVVRWS
ncbi:MAG: beta-ketoacyl-ACP synthase III [Bacillota bacterium]|nr:beta-ketoacyl-ACP synthase III [Bacillota bacterium]